MEMIKVAEAYHQVDPGAVFDDFAWLQADLLRLLLCAA